MTYTKGKDALMITKMALLLRLTFLEGEGRREFLISSHLKAIYVFFQELQCIQKMKKSLKIVVQQHMHGLYGKKVSLMLNNKEYNGKIAYRDRNKGNPYYQLSYGKELNKALKKEFIHTYLAITTEKIPYDENKTYHITTDNINREVL